jgi:hypothetical protein
VREGYGVEHPLLARVATVAAGISLYQRHCFGVLCCAVLCCGVLTVEYGTGVHTRPVVWCGTGLTLLVLVRATVLQYTYCRYQHNAGMCATVQTVHTEQVCFPLSYTITTIIP